MKILLIQAKSLEKQKLNFSRIALFHMKTRVSLKHFVNDYLWKPFSNSTRPFRPNFFDNFGNSKGFHTVLT